MCFKGLNTVLSWFLTAVSLTLSNGKKPCVAAVVINSRCPAI